MEDFTDLINNRRFDTVIPEYYENNLPKYFEEHKTAPIYEAYDLNECEAKSTISEIIDMVVNDVPFTIRQESDVVEILRIIDGYIDQMTIVGVSNHPDVAAFIQKASNARVVLSKVQEYIQNNDFNRNEQNGGPMDILRLLAIMNTPR